MVSSGFRRSLSLSGSPRIKTRPSPAGCHVRSISLPSSRPHPVLSDLHHAIDSLTSWQLHFNQSSAWLCAGLTHLELLHDSVDDLLHLPNSLDSLARPSASDATEKLLEDFLCLADAFGTFRAVLVSMKQYALDAQAATRRGDTARVASCLRSIKKTEKELLKRASSLQTPALASHQSEILGEMIRVMRESVSASTSLFVGVAALSNSASKSSFAASRSSCVIPMFKRDNNNKVEKKEEENEWKQRSLQQLEGLEECVVALESRTERLLKRIINTRVLLLNMIVPSL